MKFQHEDVLGHMLLVTQTMWCSTRFWKFPWLTALNMFALQPTVIWIVMIECWDTMAATMQYNNINPLTMNHSCCFLDLSLPISSTKSSSEWSNCCVVSISSIETFVALSVFVKIKPWALPGKQWKWLILTTNTFKPIYKGTAAAQWQFTIVAKLFLFLQWIQNGFSCFGIAQMSNSPQCHPFLIQFPNWILLHHPFCLKLLSLQGVAWCPHFL